jgi:hypothetical protein
MSNRDVINLDNLSDISNDFLDQEVIFSAVYGSISTSGESDFLRFFVFEEDVSSFASTSDLFFDGPGPPVNCCTYS